MSKKIELKGETYKYDKLEIDIKIKYVWFHISCDGSGFSVKIKKSELKEKLK